jgi:hypothetical protein
LISGGISLISGGISLISGGISLISDGNNVFLGGSALLAGGWRTDSGGPGPASVFLQWPAALRLVGLCVRGLRSPGKAAEGEERRSA